jgi:hypothetical protein
MDKNAELWAHHLSDHLTAIKLAVQLLDRRPNLSEHEHALAETAILAANSLTADLLDGRSLSWRAR